MKLTSPAARLIQAGQTLKCDVVAGLQLRGRASGKAVWMFYYRNAARVQRRPKIGDWPALQLEAAREVARVWALAVAKGEDPGADRQTTREAPDMNALFELYRVGHADTKKAELSAAEDVRNWRLHVAPRIGRIKAADLVVTDVAAVLSAVSEPRWLEVPRKYVRPGMPPVRRVKLGGPVAANRVRALISGVLTFAERSIPGGDPIRTRGTNFVPETKLNRERARRRHISSAEFAPMSEALEHYRAEHPRHVAAIWCSLLCASRVSELLDARREWLTGNRLERPDHKTERHTGADRVIRLPRQAVDIIEGLPLDGSGLLFGAGLDRWNISKVFDKVRKRAGCPDVQPRDLRRTFASVGKTRGISLEHVGDILGHAGNEKVTAGYAYLFEDAADGMVQNVADEMDRLSGKAAAAQPTALLGRFGKLRTVRGTPRR